MRPPELTFEFTTSYEVVVLERIAPRAEYDMALSFPGAAPVDTQRELSSGIVLGVRPAEGRSWIGVFELGDYGTPPAVARQVIGWPDERSLCVLQGGAGCVVQTDAPQNTFEIDCWPICDVLVIEDRGLVVFADFTSIVAYGRERLIWRTPRLAWDDVRIIETRGDALVVSAFDAPSDIEREFTVDLLTGDAPDRVWRNEWNHN